MHPGSLRFDRGTLELGPDVPDAAHALWICARGRDALAFASQKSSGAAAAAGAVLNGDLRSRWQQRSCDVSGLSLRPYQAQALGRGRGFLRRA